MGRGEPPTFAFTVDQSSRVDLGFEGSGRLYICVQKTDHFSGFDHLTTNRMLQNYCFIGSPNTATVIWEHPDDVNFVQASQQNQFTGWTLDL